MQKLRKHFANAIGILAKNLTKKQVAIISVIALAFVALFHDFFKALTGVTLLFLLGAFSTFYKKKLEGFGAIGFELVTFTTTIAGVAFGPLAGAMFGFATALSSVLISKDVGVTTPVFLLATAIAGGLAHPLSALFSIVQLGIMLVLFSTATILVFTFLFYRDAEIRAAGMLGILTNLAVNYIFFSYLAKPILAIIA
ncbi:hypothetical protein HYU40_03875 [Candidatus Woesearchaeota archaeon]|nr:hypothetical protein [Candidatus Woesearchaeota archaeon]